MKPYLRDRLACQVCGRRLTQRRDGLAKPHGRWGECRGAGYRLARWPVGQRLKHHAGAVYEVIEDRGPLGGDYLIRCVVGTAGWNGRGGEPEGAEITAHGEYMHRQGWLPVSTEAESAGGSCHVNQSDQPKGTA